MVIKNIVVDWFVVCDFNDYIKLGVVRKKSIKELNKLSRKGYTINIYEPNIPYYMVNEMRNKLAIGGLKAFRIIKKEKEVYKPIVHINTSYFYSCHESWFMMWLYGLRLK